VDVYVRRKVWGALLSIVVLLAVVAFLSIRHRAALGEATTWVFDHVGLSGLVAILFVSDAVFSPVPPDAVLVLISRSTYHPHWHVLIPVLGLLSAVAGWVGYFCGRRLAHTALASVLFRRFKQTGTAVIHRYGPWGVVLGALTPMPFSLTCWTAGMLELPFRRMVWPCLLRVPRFIVYYVAIAFAEDVVRLVL
jgi:membrane protein YqaA with SNARE-associated domain